MYQTNLDTEDLELKTDIFLSALMLCIVGLWLSSLLQVLL